MRREKVVTNAVESAPSAKRSRSMFGARKAVRKASMLREAPKSAAMTVSRINPNTRLHRTAIATTLVARVLTRFSSAIRLFHRPLRDEETLIDEGGGDQNNGHANECANPVKLIEIA